MRYINNSKIKLVVTDLDGTLLNNDKSISNVNKTIFNDLHKQNIIRVAATGRNLKISKEVLPPDFPIDYLVFSTGSGIFDWNKKQIIHKEHLNKHDITQIISFLTVYNYDFTIHNEIPNNHNFYYNLVNNDNTNFLEYINYYKQYAKKYIPSNIPEIATQILAIINHDINAYETIKSALPDYKVIRTTSPINLTSMWIEIFPKLISKASGIKLIADKHNISFENILGIGNDFNDIDFLDKVRYAFVVANAHSELKSKYRNVSSNEENGVFNAIKLLVTINN